MKILVINCGSSTIKYQLFEMDGQKVLCSGSAERIGLPQGILTHKKYPGTEEQTKSVFDEPFKTHADAMQRIVQLMLTGETAVISDVAEIKGVGHRVVHGGSLSSTVEATPDVIETVRKYIPFAPIHNPACIMGIEVAMKFFPQAKHVCVFDTAFHQTMPPEAFVYPVPYEWYEEKGVRKYGFHGTNHKYVTQRVAALMNKPVSECNFISCHIGSGASMAAIKNGKSIDTTMGMTPLAGLMMGTRCGDIDVSVLGFLMRNTNLTAEDIDTILNKQSGLTGICGKSDLRDVHAQIQAGDEKAKLALDMFVYRIKSFIGAYLVQLGRVDALIFTAGVGLNDSVVRARVLEGLEPFGFILDKQANEERGYEHKVISTDASPIKIYVVEANEELAIAQETQQLLLK